MDIYFEKAYASLYEGVENGQAEFWEFDCQYGKITYSFIKRRIPIETEEDCFDIISPYGYGGPLILEASDKEQLLVCFQEAFSQYCQDNHIVSEFVRFHPLVANAQDFASIYQPIYMRQTVGTRIDPNGETFALEFNSKARNVTRKAYRQGVSSRVIVGPDQVDNFLEIYYATMDRNQADRFYYFEPSYFDKCLATIKDKLLLIEVLLEDKVIAAGFYFISGGILHEHLIGALTEYLPYSPVYVLKAAAVDWAEQQRMELIHYGGGLTNAEDDSLLHFKKKFTKETLFDFYVAKRIHQPALYDKLCQLKGVSPEASFFPAYRQ